MHDDLKNWIPMEECKDGYVYKIAARNGGFGIYNEETKGFKLSRHKFGDNYIFEEYHWDTGAPYGTVKPLEDFGRYIESPDGSFMLPYLNALEAGCGGDINY